ncbi:hypothetical protein Jiend_32190 [Micromonospora endophytica]|uniref:sigma factor n=1 Tax=Micromonospora endophytica TaxID=515350 RepID=UPI001BB2F293|nr:sigma factor [Micromonospora endophytica]BCJ59797.1 hypothetical protein Jiend_32190 [Micromonospora endophytica]
MDDFSDFYSSRKDRVLRVVGAASGGRDAGIEDAVAEAFARAYAGWSRVSRHPDPTAWVMLTALNIQRSWWRRIRREVLVSTFSDPAPVADRVDVPAAVQSAIAELPRRQREVLAFRLLGTSHRPPPPPRCGSRRARSACISVGPWRPCVRG